MNLYNVYIDGVFVGTVEDESRSLALRLAKEIYSFCLEQSIVLFLQEQTK